MAEVALLETESTTSAATVKLNGQDVISIRVEERLPFDVDPQFAKLAFKYMGPEWNIYVHTAQPLAELPNIGEYCNIEFDLTTWKLTGRLRR